MRHCVLAPEKVGLLDFLKLAILDRRLLSKFLQSTEADAEGKHERWWKIFLSLLMMKLLAFLKKPMELTGNAVEFILNLLSLNGGPIQLFFSILTRRVVIPEKRTERFISTIGQLDGRVDVHERRQLAAEMNNDPLIDLCVIASKVAYENEMVVKSIVHDRWNMNFVGFYNCWNDFQKQFSTQVFVMTDDPRDAGLILVAFRGTEPFDADDWTTDFDYSWYEVAGVGKIHVGFLEALGLGSRDEMEEFMKDVPPEMAEKSAYYTVARTVRSLLKAHCRAKFVVTGHSMGGALAILFNVVMVLHDERDMARRWSGTYTFGQPRIGNEQLGHFMGPHLRGRFLRVVYANDLVARLPYDDKNFMYKHFGTCLYYTPCFVPHQVEEAPDKNFFGIRYVISMRVNALREVFRGLTMGHVYGPEYKEGWFCVFFRLVGVLLPGISAHSMTNYINSVRLGKQNH